jgi:hypothetical protein
MCVTSAMVGRYFYRGVIAKICELNMLAEMLFEEISDTKNSELFLQCSDTVVVFSERIEPASENNIKSESFS